MEDRYPARVTTLREASTRRWAETSSGSGDLEIERARRVAKLRLAGMEVESRRRATRKEIVIGCSARKLSGPARADELYRGVVWSTWRKYRPEPWPPHWRVWALSARHGLIPGDREIEPYEAKLELSGVSELARRRVASQAEGLQGEVVMVGGELYHQVLVEAGVSVAIWIDGRSGRDGRGGIGRLRARLRQWCESLGAVDPSEWRTHRPDEEA